jgi:hypothetical protein
VAAAARSGGDLPTRPGSPDAAVHRRPGGYRTAVTVLVAADPTADDRPRGAGVRRRLRSAFGGSGSRTPTRRACPHVLVGRRPVPRLPHDRRFGLVPRSGHRPDRLGRCRRPERARLRLRARRIIADLTAALASAGADPVDRTAGDLERAQQWAAQEAPGLRAWCSTHAVRQAPADVVVRDATRAVTGAPDRIAARAVDTWKTATDETHPLGS